MQCVIYTCIETIKLFFSVTCKKKKKTKSENGKLRAKINTYIERTLQLEAHLNLYRTGSFNDLLFNTL